MDTNSAAVKAYAQKAFEAETDKLSRAPSGERNHQLFKSAANLFELVAAEVLDESKVTDALREAAVPMV